MIRNLWVLVLAGTTAMALAAIGASGASAAEFHCSVEPCIGTLKPDGAVGSKTAHHVFIIRKGATSASVTCNQLAGEAEVATKTAAEVTIRNLVYSECSILGTPVTIDMNGCDYKFKAEGIKSLACPTGKTVQFTLPTCTISIPEQQTEGASFHNVGSQETNTTEMTIELLLKKIKGTVSGSGCAAIFGFTGEFTEGEYTTGNTLVTAETKAGVMANVWWQ